ncbi:hypothetical protein ACFT9M_19575 [Micromonospora purpureochromogenes]|uniref:hypothetical protein n=1 Tax=Micromonospora purpureochromogenes TaxID=47872 RepID=UPI00363A3ACB
MLRVAEGHEDTRAAEFGGVPPETRLSTSLHEFIRAVRVQLRVPDPERIASDEPDDWPELTDGQRRSIWIAFDRRAPDAPGKTTTTSTRRSCR